MFTELRLKNFKAWKDAGSIPLKPVTMLLGTNSSGKSTLIQSLLLLKQTVQSSDRTVHLNLGGDEINDIFNFGGFEDVLYRGSGGGRQFLIGFDFDRQGKGRVASGRFDASYGQTSTGSVTVQSLRLEAQGRVFQAIRRDKGAFSILVDDEQQPRGKGRNMAPERSVAFPADAIVELGGDAAVAQDLSLAIQEEFKSISYLGPLRRRPERDYQWNKSKPGDVGTDGRRAVDALLASAILKGDGQNQVVDGVSAWLNRMKVADKLEVRQQGRSTRYELLVHRNGLACNLRDVGIGISQVLPVLVLAYFAPEGSTVILEEPEIHLHPLAQSVLAELFVETSKKRKIQFIVETHSEHLFRRMQTLIAKEVTSPDDTALYFVRRDGDESRMMPLKVDEYGRLHDWPDGFFGDALGETREQARLAFIRQRKN